MWQNPQTEISCKRKRKRKYKSLYVEIKRMWNLKCTITPVKTGATGTVAWSLRKNLEAAPGKYSVDSLQKTAILGTSHIIRKVLQCETWSLSGGDHRWFKRSTRKKCLWQETYILYNNNNNNNSNRLFQTYPKYSILVCCLVILTILWILLKLTAKLVSGIDK